MAHTSYQSVVGNKTVEIYGADTQQEIVNRLAELIKKRVWKQEIEILGYWVTDAGIYMCTLFLTTPA